MSAVVNTENLEGTIFNIQKMSIHDGPGIRTTVFLKGCPMRCLWCSNPESQNMGLEIACFKSRCIDCGYCAGMCPQGIIENGNDYDIVERDKCDLCMVCVNECCTNAKKLIGESYSPQTLLDEILQDKSFYGSSGGGVTFSGGEPFMQAEFLLTMLRLCKEVGLHTAVETTGLADTKDLLEAAKYLDLFFVDLKHMENETHKKLTDVGNEVILENLALLAKHHDNIIVRIPVVPGLNDTPENIRASANYVASLGIRTLELLPYHNLGENKYGQLGMEYTLSGTENPSSVTMEELAEIAREAIGVRNTSVQVMESM